MADNGNNILNHLQQYGMQPPADAFSKAWEHIADAKEKNPFGQLQDYSMAAPALDFSLLKNAAGQNNIPLKRHWVIPIPVMRAAAVLLVVATGITLYFSFFRQKESTQNNYAGVNVNQSPATASPNGQNNGPDMQTANNAANSIAAANTTAAGKNSYAAGIKTKKGFRNKNSIAKAGRRNSATLANNSFIQLYDNDIFFTLISYKGGKNSTLQKFFADNTYAEKKISLNKYSYVNLSDKMVAMLQDIYLTKKNGKPARKAKKTKKKFDKWKKKDEKYFDSNMQKNPIDVIDLSDFILK